MVAEKAKKLLHDGLNRGRLMRRWFLSNQSRSPGGEQLTQELGPRLVLKDPSVPLLTLTREDDGMRAQKLRETRSMWQAGFSEVIRPCYCTV